MGINVEVTTATGSTATQSRMLSTVVSVTNLAQERDVNGAIPSCERRCSHLLGFSRRPVTRDDGGKVIVELWIGPYPPPPA